MNQKSKVCLLTVLCFLGVYLCMPMTASANLVLQDFIESMEVNGDLRIRYEYKEKDVSGEDATDRMRTRFRMGMKWINPEENWKIAAGLCTGGEDATSTNDTWSESDPAKDQGGFFETGDIRLDYAYAEHKLNQFKFIAGQQKNPFATTWALWDGDVRPTGFTAQVALDPIFITTGWYDVAFYDNDMAQMEAIQTGIKAGIFTGALAYYNYNGDSQKIMGNFLTSKKFGQKTTGDDGEVTYDLDYMDPDYKWQIIDLYANFDIKAGDVAEISPHFQVFYNMGAKGKAGQSIQGGTLDPEEENMGYLVGVSAKFIKKISLGIEYADIGADSCVPLLKDSDFGDGLGYTDVKGFKIELGYKLTKNCKLAGTAFLYQAKERDIDQDPTTYQFDLSYKF